MTTRKELIERIQAMQLGTQKMLDAAAEDATLIPLETLFLDEKGRVVWRNNAIGFSDKRSVAFTIFGADWEYKEASCLAPMNED